MKLLVVMGLAGPWHRRTGWLRCPRCGFTVRGGRRGGKVRVCPTCRKRVGDVNARMDAGAWWSMLVPALKVRKHYSGHPAIRG